MEEQFEKVLSETFNYKSRMVVSSRQQLKAVVDQRPEEFGMHPDTNKYDVGFLKQPLTAEKAITEVVARKEVDNFYAENGVLYFRGLSPPLQKLFKQKYYPSYLSAYDHQELEHHQ